VSAVPQLVSVVIPTRDGADTLPELVAALARQRTRFDVEVIAIDSGSRDATREILCAAGVGVHEIAPGDFDHGETRNAAITLATGDPIVLLTQDAVPQGEGFLEALVAPFTDPEVVAVYGRQIPRADCDAVTRRQLEAAPTGRDEAARAQCPPGSLATMQPAQRLHLCTFDNVCSALRREFWRDHPFPRSDFGEDVAFGRSVIEAGLAIAYTPAAAVVHSHRRSLGYEFRRTRLCHRRLHELFELETLPHAAGVARATLANWRRDLPWVWRHAPPGAERARQLLRIAALSFVSPLAQHLGSRDARRGTTS